MAHCPRLDTGFSRDQPGKVYDGVVALACQGRCQRDVY
jgi:hypothetical protein